MDVFIVKESEYKRAGFIADSTAVEGHTLANADFLHAGAIGAGVGGNLVNREWIEREEWGKCTALARAYVQAARG